MQKPIKLKKCINCNKDFKPSKTTQKVCSLVCASKIAKIKEIEKKAKEKANLENFEIERKLEKSLKASLINTRVQVHAFVRERDKGLPCISCGVQWNETFQAGHFFKAETYTTLKFNLENIHGQCTRCNLRLDGNVQNYSLNLPKRIGQEKFNQLIKLAEIDKQSSKVWNLENLKEIREKFKK